MTLSNRLSASCWSAAAAPIVASATLFSAPADAVTWTWVNDRKIVSLLIADAGVDFLISGPEDADVNSSCPNWFRISTSDANYELKSSGLLTAYARGDSLNVSFDLDSTACYTPVQRIAVYPD